MERNVAHLGINSALELFRSFIKAVSVAEQIESQRSRELGWASAERQTRMPCRPRFGCSLSSFTALAYRSIRRNRLVRIPRFAHISAHPFSPRLNLECSCWGIG